MAEAAALRALRRRGVTSPYGTRVEVPDDTAGARRADGSGSPARERVHLTTGGDYWHYANATSRAVDYDHPRPYVDPGRGGPPGQTGTHNCGPLARRHHRWKTHAGYRSRQSGQGRYASITPHELAFLVDHRGTRRIDPEQARLTIDAPPGLDIYPSDLDVEIDLQTA